MLGAALGHPDGHGVSGAQGRAGTQTIPPGLVSSMDGSKHIISPPWAVAVINNPIRAVPLGSA